MEDITSFSISNASGEYNFVYEDDNWYYADNRNFPISQDNVEMMTDLLADFTATNKYKSDEADQLSAYGLDEPDVTLVIQSKTQGEMTFAVADTGDYYYMQVAGDDSVYVIDDTLYTFASQNLYGMAEISQPEGFGESSVESVTVSGESNTVLQPETVTTEDEDGESTEEVHWYLVQGDTKTDVTENDLVVTLKTAISDLYFEQMVYYSESGTAFSEYGIDDNSPILRIAYKDDDDNTAYFELKIGNLTEDESYYYVNIPGDAAIYTINSEYVSAVVQIAQSGIAQ